MKMKIPLLVFSICYVHFLALARCGEVEEDWYDSQNDRENNDPRAGYVVIGDHQYYLDDVTQRDWLKASEFCSALDMRLYSIESPEEELEVNTYLTNSGVGDYDYWTSGTYIEGSWFWMGSGTPFTYEHWLPGEPNHHEDNETAPCVYATLNGWADEICEEYKYYICEE